METGVARGGLSMRRIGLFALIMTAVAETVGSGWLFGVGNAAKMAGPGAIVAWMLGGLLIGLVAVSVAEVGAMFPRMGGLGRFMLYSHGELAGFIGDWASFVAMAGTAMMESTAIVQYASSWTFPWAGMLIDKSGPSAVLTTLGLTAASGVLLLIFVMNYYSLKFLMHSVKVLTVFKFVVLFAAISIPLYIHFEMMLDMADMGLMDNFRSFWRTEVFGEEVPGYVSPLVNFWSHGGFMPYGWTGVFSAIASAGIVFAYNGFQMPVSFAGEAKNPGRNIPLAILLSVLVVVVLYTTLQFTYIVAMPEKMLAAGGGAAWAGVRPGRGCGLGGGAAWAGVRPGRGSISARPTRRWSWP